jgi:rSAM/selenodomain-associated transferase 1
VNIAIGVMARAPSSPGKTRLAGELSPSRLTALRAALFADTLHAVAPLPIVTVFFTPDDAEAEIASFASVARRVPQGGGDLGVRMRRALQFLLQPSMADTASELASEVTPDAAILVGSDIPLLTAADVTEAATVVSTHGGVALGPADDGGYYLIGMTKVHAELFEGILWGTETVLADTLRTAERLGLDAHRIRSLYDVDTIDDLLRLERDLAWLPSSACPALRRWFSEV